MIFCVSSAFRLQGSFQGASDFLFKANNENLEPSENLFKGAGQTLDSDFIFLGVPTKKIRVWSLFFGGRDMWIKSGMFQGGKRFKILIQP